MDIPKKMQKGKNRSVGMPCTFRPTCASPILAEKGHSLGHIALERDLSEGTIVTHLLKIAEQYPETDLSKFKPKKSTLDKVEKAYKLLLEQEGKISTNKQSVSLKPLFELLNGEVDYEDIKLALVFL